MTAKAQLLVALATFVLAAVPLPAQQGPSYAKQVRPLLAKYCLECHNARAMKGGLNLETYQSIMEGSDRGPVVKAGKPNASRMVLVCEGKEKPIMPPAKAKFQPKADEIAILRDWVAAGARDDGAGVKIVLPPIKPREQLLPPVTALAYVPGKNQLFIARNKQLMIVDFAGESIKSSETTAPADITALATAPSSEIVIAAISQPGAHGDALTVPLSASPKWTMDYPLGHTDGILDLAYHPRTRLLASAGYDMQIRLTDTVTKKVKHLLKEHSDAVHGLAFNPDGSLLASVSADRALKVTDVETGKLLYTRGEATDWLYAVAWSPDGKYLVSGGVDKSLRVYEASAKGAKLRQSVFGHEGPIQKLVFSGDSRTLYSVGQDRVVKAWDVERMVENKVYDAQPETVLCLVLRDAARQIIVGRYDGVVQLIDMMTGKVVHEFGKAKMEPKTSARPHPQQAFVSASSGEKQNEKSIPQPGSSPATGQKIALGARIAGTLDRAGAAHYFGFDAKQGEPLGMKLVTKDLKSKVDPVLLVTDLSGRILAESNEGHLGYTFAESGQYAIGVRDREYRGGTDFTYSLQLGKIPIVTAVFPMGMQRGTKGDVHVDGVFLPRKIVSFSVPADAKVGQALAISVGDGTLGKAQIVVGEFPEVAGAGVMPVPGTANGRITQENQKDSWVFPAKKGQRLIAEVSARRIGSRLDSIIEILDKDDQPVPRALLRSQAKTHVTFRDHDSAAPGIRIEAWSELATNDLLYVGTELMKIQSLPTHPDADCNFFSTGGQRLAYFDTTPTHHSNNTPMYKVKLFPPGTAFPPNGFPVFTLYYRNDDGGPGYGRDSRVIFDPPADGMYKVRIADARGMAGDNFGYRLTVRPPRPSFLLRYTPANPVVPRSGAIPITVTAERTDGFNGPIQVRVKNLPPGFSMPATTIEGGTYSTTVALHAEATAKLPDKGIQPMIEGEANDTSRKIDFQERFDLPKLTDPGDIVTTTAETEVAIKPGQQTKLTVRIERRNGFTGRVPLDVKGLPHGVRVLDIGLNGILITERETTRTIALYAEPWVQPASHPFVVLAKREGNNTEHAAKSVVLVVK